MDASQSLPDDGRADLSAPRRTKVGVVLLVAVLHVALMFGLVRAFSPGTITKAAETVLSTFTVTVTTPPPSPPPPERAPDKSGAAGNVGKKADANQVAAPQPKIPIAKTPAPKAPGSGSANVSGAGNAGSGTGAGGVGSGPGAGAGGTGTGGGMPTRPSVASGELNESRDFPIPPGGRQTRFGKQVIVVFTVTVDGRARDCSVSSSGVDPETTALVCPLVMRKVRFNPARRGDGTPYETRYGYKVIFKQT